jgi:hypothetical protein
VLSTRETANKVSRMKVIETNGANVPMRARFIVFRWDVLALIAPKDIRGALRIQLEGLAS